jgi:hypothetical protein
MLDEFLSEYGWTIEQAISCTYHQLSALGRKVAQRSVETTKQQLDVFRIAQHGSKEDFSRYVRSLDSAVPKALEKQTPAVGEGDVPTGISYKKA